MTGKIFTVGRSALSFAVLFIVWWFLTAFNVVPRAYLPSPVLVGEAFAQGLADGSLLENLWISILRLLTTFVVASALGVAVGVAMGLAPNLGRFFRPILSFFNSLSGITWLPLAIAWFGIGERTIAFVIFNSVFFIVAFNTLTGVQTVPKVFEQTMLTLGSGRLRLIADVLIPGALPNIITGLRLAMGFGWRALIAVEMVAGAIGMGYMIFNASYVFRQDIIMMGILVVGAVALAIDQLLFAPLERGTIERWGLV